MQSERIIVRTKTNLSYAGAVCNRNYGEAAGILIKPSPKSNIKVWFPIDEIQCIIKMDGVVVEGEELRHECGLYKDL